MAFFFSSSLHSEKTPFSHTMATARHLSALEVCIPIQFFLTLFLSHRLLILATLVDRTFLSTCEIT